jgi:hypothetical protein
MTRGMKSPTGALTGACQGASCPCGDQAGLLVSFHNSARPKKMLAEARLLESLVVILTAKALENTRKMMSPAESKICARVFRRG